MAALPFPHEFHECDEKTNQRAISLQTHGFRGGVMTVGKDHYFYPKVPQGRFTTIYNYPLDPRDTWVVTMPKCGTTWTQEMAWLIANNCDFEGAKSYLVPNRWNFLEMSYGVLMPDSALRSLLWSALWQAPWKAARALWLTMQMMWPRSFVSPRFVKSHFPFSMLPPKLLDTCKVIYVARNPKDALVSYYHHHKLMKGQGFVGTFQDFFDAFLDDNLVQLPFIPHVREAWEKKSHPNMLFLFFEDMKADLRAVIKRVGDFLGKNLSEKQVERLHDHLNFENFKKNPWVNFDMFKELGMMNEGESFVRKGKTGDWKNYFSAEMNDRMDAWIAQRLQGTDLRFQMELKHQD